MAAPEAPQLRAYVLSGGKIALRWRDVTDADSYDLYRGGYREDPLLVGDERQQIAVRATSGTFKVSVGAAQTDALNYDITAADLATALNALVTVAPGGSIDVTRTTVTGGFDFVLTFQGTFSRTNVSPVTTDASSLSGGTHSAAVTTLTAGGPYDDDVTSPYIDSVTAGTRKVYLLRARNASGDSDPSNVVSLQNAAITDHSDDTRVPTAVRSSIGQS